MKKLLCIILVISLLVCTVGCSGTPEKERDSEETVLYTDDCGREVELPAEITRIVPTGPVSQIMLYTLVPEMFVGLAAKWAGSAEDIVPEEYLQLPYFGQLYNISNLNIEQLALADPQVIIDIGRVISGGSEDMDTLQRQTNIPSVFVGCSMDSMGETYRKLGKLLDREERAEQLAAFYERVYNRTVDIMNQVGDNKVNALYVTGEAGLNVMAKNSVHSELIDLLTNNLAVVDNPSSKGSGNEVTMEQIALWNPDFVIFSGDSIYDTVSELDAWSEIFAIVTGNYIKGPEGPHNWMGSPPAVQRCLGMIWLTAQLYPEFCDYNPEAEVLEFYELFYQCALTQEQFDRLVAGAVLGGK